jgi:hypothetical protein
VPADPGVVLDASALVAYSQNDLLAFPLDELLRELREDTGGPVHIPEYALVDARVILHDDKTALARLESFAAAHGCVQAIGRGDQETIQLIVADAGVSWGLAHAMLLAAVRGALLATYVASTLHRAGFDARLILDLDEFFRPE